MTYIEDLENARRYISALVNNDRDAMDASIEPYAGEGRNRDGLIRALARMVLLQAGPKADLEQYLDHLVKSPGRTFTSVIRRHTHRARRPDSLSMID